MARTIIFASSKGGTGKTVLVANIGAAMARLGKKVAIIDADINMANLGLITGLEGRKTTLHEVLAGEAPVSSAICGSRDGLKILPMGMSIDGINKADPNRLVKVIKDLSRNFEILLVDSPSGMDRDAMAALKASQEMVLVITPDIAAVSNALRLKTIAEKLGVKPIGIIVSRATDKNLDLPSEEISTALELPILGKVLEDEAVRKSLALGEFVVTHSPKSRAALEIKRLAATISGRKAGVSPQRPQRRPCRERN